MIKICPAILTDDISEFNTQLEQLNAFDSIDFDIMRPPFVVNSSLAIEEIIALIDKVKVYSPGFHLMVNDPENDIKKVINSNLVNLPCRIYVHQEVDLNFIEEFEWPTGWTKAIALKLETNLKSLEYYVFFDEIQLMSVEIGAQGGEFDEKALEKVDRLREIGYSKIVSLDGGINLKTANLIKLHKIDRVSVGSFFSKTDEDVLEYMKLDLALNMKPSELE